MFTYPIGSFSVFPREAYRPQDLDDAGHVAVRDRIVRAGKRFGLDDEAAEEAGSQFYAHWLGREWSRSDVPRGDHSRAVASILAYAKRSHFHGFTGQRRQARGKRVERGSDGQPIRQSVRKACQEELAQRERMRERNSPLPCDPAIGRERIEGSPHLHRKAKRLAQRLGCDVETLVANACGFRVE